jgi:hypothetical protein
VGKAYIMKVGETFGPNSGPYYFYYPYMLLIEPKCIHSNKDKIIREDGRLLSN